MKINYKCLKYAFLIPCLQIPENILVNLDNDYCLFHIEHPPSPLFIFRKDYGNIEQSMLNYYSDCISFLHDLPSIVINHENDRKFTFSPLIQSKNIKEYGIDIFYRSLESVYYEITNVRLNGSVLFFSEEALSHDISVDISYFKKVLQEIKLYNTALKQKEPNIEFFMYCRVLESIGNGLNGQWIKRHVNHLLDYDFGEINVFKTGKHITESNEIDYINLLKNRCKKRLLNIKRNNIDIGNYYAKTIRNSIAHGRLEIYENMNINEITEDNIVMKLLCRYAIMRKYS